MELHVCRVSVAPVRRSASDKSEMVTQILFGETVKVLEKKGTWRKIRCSWDDYQGWTDHKLLLPIEEKPTSNVYTLELTQAVMAEDHFVPVLMGSRLPAYDGMGFSLGEKRFTYSGQVVTPSEHKPSAALMMKIARKYLNAPYLWGGRSPFGIDCSGFTQSVFKMIGVKLLRDASQQVTQGEIVDFVEQSRAGDLAFFENRAGRVAHVGIVFPENKIIHAHGRVRMDNLDHYGIFNEETQKYTHRLRVVKRLMPEDFSEIPAPGETPATKPANQPGLFG